MERFTGLARAALFSALLLPFSTTATAAYHTDPPPDDAPRIATPLVVTPWAKRSVHNGIAYFLYPSSSTISRFDLVAQNWLTSLSVPADAITFDVDADGIFVALADSVVRLDLAGTSVQTIPNIAGGQTTLELGPGFVLVARDRHFRTYSKSQGIQLGAADIWYSVQTPSVLSASARVYSWYNGLSPSDIVAVAWNPGTGALSSSIESPYHGAFPAAQYVYASEQSDVVVDNTGTVYSEQLIHRGNLGGHVESAAFLQDRFVVLRGSDLIVYSNALRELGRMRAPFGIVDIFSANGSIYAATYNGTTVVAPLNLSDARPPAPGSARPWAMTAMRADEVLEAGTGVLFVSKTENAAYRFDPQTWTTSAPSALLPNPDRVAYSPLLDTLFASYVGGAIYAHPLSQPGTANYLSSTVFTPHGLATAGEFVFAADASGAWNSHFTFGPDGDRRSWVEWNYNSLFYTWDTTTRKMYFFRNDQSPGDLHWEQLSGSGEIIAEGESPYHGEIQAIPPIRISPNQATIVLGSGQLLSASNLTLSGNLQTQVTDVAWSGGDLYAVDAQSPAHFLRFDSMQNVLSSGRVRGTPRRLLPMANGNFLYIADTSGRTVVGVLDAFLTQADIAVDLPTSGNLLAGGSTITVGVTVGNNGSVAAQGVRVTAALSAFQNVTWQCVPEAFAGGCDNQVHTGVLDNVIALGDGGQVRYLITATVPASAAGTIGFPIQAGAATNASDPELGNNSALVEFRLDRLFKDGFQ